MAAEIKKSGVLVTKVHRCSALIWLWIVQVRKAQSELSERFTKYLFKVFTWVKERWRGFRSGCKLFITQALKTVCICFDGIWLTSWHGSCFQLWEPSVWSFELAKGLSVKIHLQDFVPRDLLVQSRKVSVSSIGLTSLTWEATQQWIKIPLLPAHRLVNIWGANAWAWGFQTDTAAWEERKDFVSLMCLFYGTIRPSRAHHSKPAVSVHSHRHI